MNIISEDSAFTSTRVKESQVIDQHPNQELVVETLEEKIARVISMTTALSSSSSNIMTIVDHPVELMSYTASKEEVEVIVSTDELPTTTTNTTTTTTTTATTIDLAPVEEITQNKILDIDDDESVNSSSESPPVNDDYEDYTLRMKAFNLRKSQLGQLLTGQRSSTSSPSPSLTAEIEIKESIVEVTESLKSKEDEFYLLRMKEKTGDITTTTTASTTIEFMNTNGEMKEAVTLDTIDTAVVVSTVEAMDQSSTIELPKLDLTPLTTAGVSPLLKVETLPISNTSQSVGVELQPIPVIITVPLTPTSLPTLHQLYPHNQVNYDTVSGDQEQLIHTTSPDRSHSISPPLPPYPTFPRSKTPPIPVRSPVIQTRKGGTTRKPPQSSSTTLPPTAPTTRVVRVAVRVRPFTKTETDTGSRRVVSYSGNRLIIVNPTAFDADPDAVATAAAAVQCKEWAQVFKFNNILWSHEVNEDEELYVSQEGVHRVVGSEIVENVLNGVSCCCFAYGHTGETLVTV